MRAVRLLVFDFDGVFTDNAVYVFEDGREAVRCHRGDGIGLRQLERLGIQLLVISTETNPVVSARCRKLAIACVQGCPEKGAELERQLRERGLTLSQAAYMGNDVNDLVCLSRVGLPIVVRDAHPDVLPCAAYQTLAGGGQGAVREVADLFARVLERTPELTV